MLPSLLMVLSILMDDLFIEIVLFIVMIFLTIGFNSSLFYFFNLASYFSFLSCSV